MKKLNLISAFKKTLPQNNYVPPHSHNYHELVYYCYGSGTTTVGRRTYSFTNSSFVLIPPHVVHDERSFSAGEVLCFIFSGPDDLQQIYREDPLQIIGRISRELMHEVQAQEYGYQVMIRAKLDELYLQILRTGHAAAREKNFEYIIHYIEENYHEKIVLTECARQLNLSYDHFQHKFKALTGLSPKQYLTRQRLRAAKNLLLSGTLSCTEIAQRCGFSTSAQFSALFKKEFGCAPTQFQKRSQPE